MRAIPVPYGRSEIFVVYCTGQRAVAGPAPMRIARPLGDMARILVD